MSQAIPEPAAPPRLERRRRRTLVAIEAARDAQLRRRGFWAGWGGVLTSLLISGLVIALLVGWVLLWVTRPDGPNIPLLVLGCVAFSAILLIVPTLQNRLIAHWKMRQVEAAFVSGVSHNLRTPVAAIRAAAQALAHVDVKPEQHDKLLAAIIHQTRRLGLRLDNVLETGRLEVERQAFIEEEVDLAELVRSCAEPMEPLAAARGGTLAVDLEGPMHVQGDGSALRLAVDNLLDNALKYASGPPVIHVELRSVGEFATLRIVDTGLGFEPARSKHLFKRFARGNADRSGTGLGLPLARAIARGHGGELEMHSDGPGTGARAELWLPKTEED